MSAPRPKTGFTNSAWILSEAWLRPIQNSFPLSSEAPVFTSIPWPTRRTPGTWLANVKKHWIRNTLDRDLSEKADIKFHMRRSANVIGRRLRKKNYVAFGVGLKLKTTNFQLISRRHRLSEPTDLAERLYLVAVDRSKLVLGPRLVRSIADGSVVPPRSHGLLHCQSALKLLIASFIHRQFLAPSIGRLVLVGVPSDWSIPSATRGLLPA